jgi:hypothetical protein
MSLIANESQNVDAVAVLMNLSWIESATWWAVLLRSPQMRIQSTGGRSISSKLMRQELQVLAGWEVLEGWWNPKRQEEATIGICHDTPRCPSLLIKFFSRPRD